MQLLGEGDTYNYSLTLQAHRSSAPTQDEIWFEYIIQAEASEHFIASWYQSKQLGNSPVTIDEGGAMKGSNGQHLLAGHEAVLVQRQRDCSTWKNSRFSRRSAEEQSPIQSCKEEKQAIQQPMAARAKWIRDWKI